MDSKKSYLEGIGFHFLSTQRFTIQVVSMTSLPLARFRVLDLTRVRAGHTAVRQLADWGANVIKVEAPDSSAEGNQNMFGSRHGPDFPIFWMTSRP